VLGIRRLCCFLNTQYPIPNTQYPPMLQGKFAQLAEFLSIVLILVGIVMLCQPFSFFLFQNGFTFLLVGWLGLNIFSHRKPVR
jgi:hypothetical protein